MTKRKLSLTCAEMRKLLEEGRLKLEAMTCGTRHKLLLLPGVFVCTYAYTMRMWLCDIDAYVAIRRIHHAHVPRPHSCTHVTSCASAHTDTGTHTNKHTYTHARAHTHTLSEGSVAVSCAEARHFPLDSMGCKSVISYIKKKTIFF
jgi:hypothetical protein